MKQTPLPFPAMQHPVPCTLHHMLINDMIDALNAGRRIREVDVFDGINGERPLGIAGYVASQIDRAHGLGAELDSEEVY